MKSAQGKRGAAIVQATLQPATCKKAAKLGHDVHGPRAPILPPEACRPAPSSGPTADRGSAHGSAHSSTHDSTHGSTHDSAHGSAHGLAGHVSRAGTLPRVQPEALDRSTAQVG